MIEAQSKTVSFDEFVAWYPENSEHRYELHQGTIIEMPKPRGKHSEIAGFLNLEFGLQCRHNNSSCLVPREAIVKPFRDNSGYEPDVIVLERDRVINEPRWEAESIITMGSSVRLIVEVVSTNWRDDYCLKVADYEEMGITEYWIVDYLGLGGKRFIGSPKQPTISIYQMVEGEYQVNQFRGNDLITSLAFPKLNLTAEQIFKGL